MMDYSRTYIDSLHPRCQHINLIDTALWNTTLKRSILLYLGFFRKISYTHSHVCHPERTNKDEYLSSNSSNSLFSIPDSNSSVESYPLIYSCDDTYTHFNSNNNANEMNDTNTIGPTTGTIEHSLVVNLSSSHLNSDAIELLSKGVKFCPTPGEPDISRSQQDLDSFHLRLKRYLHFYAAPNPDNQSGETEIIGQSQPVDGPFKNPTFKNRSSWVPPPCIPLEIFIAQNNSDLLHSKIQCPRRQNISKEQRSAIKELYNNTNIVIKPADKGGAIVILNREDYIKEGIRQLSDNNFYIQTDTDLSKQHFDEIKAKLDEMTESNEIDRSCADFLSNPKYRTSQFYMLPKIHKRLDNPPGRPIVSGNGCPTERISQFVDFFLKPIVQDIRSYIKDTTHFLTLLEEVGPLPDNTLLVTLDVSSLYTNIPNDIGIQACKEKLDHYRTGALHPRNDSIIDLLTMVLSKNNFDFNDLHYLQVGGTAMGTRLAPSYANIFMDHFERNFVYTYETQPLLWKRYIDDIFILWDPGGTSLRSFYRPPGQPPTKHQIRSSCL